MVSELLGEVLNEKLSPNEIFWSFLILALGTLLYAPSLAHGFLWDDSTYVWHTPLVSTWTGLKAIWLDPKMEEYYPITFSVHWLEHKLWGLHPSGYHAFSLTLHLMNALLFFGLVRRWAPSLAGIAALLFAVHPLQVETVAWISEQKNLLCLFFTLLAFHAFLDFDAGGKKRAYARTLLFFIAALLSKSIAVCFAFIPLLYRWWKEGCLRKHDLLQSLPFFIIGGIFAFIHLHLLSLYSIDRQIAVFSLTSLQKILLSGRIFFFYIRQTLLPWDFMTLYPPWPLSVNSPGAWLYPASALALYATLFWKRHSLGRAPFALLCFYGLSLFPVLGFLDFSYHRYAYVADHFTYLSTPALLLLICLGVSRLFSKLSAGRARNPKTFFPLLRTSLIAAVVIFLSLLSFNLTKKYKDSPTFWNQLLHQNPETPFAHYFLGTFCLDNPNACTPEDTILHFQKAILLKPDYLLAYMCLGDFYKKTGRPQDALDAYQSALILARPFTEARAYRSIADIYLKQDKPADALPFLEKALSLEKDPGYQQERRIYTQAALGEAFTRSSIGRAYFLLGENQKAAEWFNRALRRQHRE